MRRIGAISALILLLLLPAIAGAQDTSPVITITSPLSGQIVNPDEIVVSGTGAGLPDNEITVQVQDAAGVSIDDQTATINGEIGASGQWQIVFSLGAIPEATPGSAGFIYAYVESPDDDAPLAEARVNITFGPSETPPGEQPPAQQPSNAPSAEISISAPANGEIVNESAVTVVGSASGVPDNNLHVVARTSDGTVLAEQLTTVAAEPGGSGGWQVTLTPNAAPGTIGQIYVFAQSANDSSLLAQAAVNVTFGSAPQEESPLATPTETPPSQAPPAAGAASAPDIQISAPAPGQDVGAGEIGVVGSASGLPDNNLTVQVLDANGNVLTEQTTTVAAEPGGAGEWRATLTPDTSLGVPAQIHAYAPSSADGSILAEATTDITYGSTPIPAVLRIVSPLPGEVVSPTDLLVSGTGAGLPDNNVVVRAIGPDGRVLAEEAVTVNAEPGAIGQWRALLQVDVAEGALGWIYVLSPTADGQVIAEASANVQFGQAAPPSLIIQEPANGATVDTNGGFTVSGSATNLGGKNLIVRVRDAYGRTLKEFITRAHSDGSWAVAFDFLHVNEMAGSIYVFAAGANNSVTVDDLVHVTFVGPCSALADWPLYTVLPGDTLFRIAQRTDATPTQLVQANCLADPNYLFVGQALRVPQLPGPVVISPPQPPSVTIVSPTLDSALPLDSPVVISGVAQGAQPRTIFVRALDNNGKVLAESQGSVTQAAEADGAWSWEAKILVRGEITATRGLIYAYSPSFVDGTVIAAAQIAVIYGEDNGAPYVTIDDPAPYTRWTDSGALMVSGRGRGFAQGQLLVQAVDMAGRILADVAAEVVGGEGGEENTWTATLPVEAVRRGEIDAIVQNADPTAPVVRAGRAVYFGDPAMPANYAVITYPLPDTIFTNNTQFLAVTGYAGGVDQNKVTVLVLDDAGDVRFSLPVQVDPNTGFWSILTRWDNVIRRDQRLNVQVVGASVSNGQIIARDRVTVYTRRADATVTGFLQLPDQASLPADAIAAIQLQYVVDPNEPTAVSVLGGQTMRNLGAAPIPFAVPYSSADVDEAITYVLVARIEDGVGNALFTLSEPLPVITQDNPTEGVEVVLQEAAN